MREFDREYDPIRVFRGLLFGLLFSTVLWAMLFALAALLWWLL